MKVISLNEAKQFIQRVLICCGLEKYASARATDAILFADRRGFVTHGIKNLFRIYAPQLRRGTVNSRARATLLKGGGAIGLIDGCHELGLVAGTKAMRLAMLKARRYGIGMVVIRNSTHFGSAGFYSSMAAKRGYIGIALSNCGSQVIAPPPGGLTRMLGTNPLSVALPGNKMPRFCLDMSTTIVSTGQINKAAQEGRSIPAGWLFDHEGKSTDDPFAYSQCEAELAFLGGTPDGGVFKGFGLSIVVEALSALLANAGTGPRSNLCNGFGMDPPGNDIGQAFIAINPNSFEAGCKFKERVDAMLSTIRSCVMIDQSQKASYPGYPEALHEDSTLKHGIELSEHVWSEMSEWAKKLKIDIPRLDETSPSFEENWV